MEVRTGFRSGSIVPSKVPTKTGGPGFECVCVLPLMALKRLLASALSTESKYQTVMAYLRAVTGTHSDARACVREMGIRVGLSPGYLLA